MAKLTTVDVASGYASVAALNNNFALIEVALENTVSRDGTIPNQMEADLDLNGNALLNIGTLDVTSLSVDSLTIGGSVVVPTGTVYSALPAQATFAGKYLKTDGTNATWQSVSANAGINVKDAPYSAVGDGVADDTAAIQAAITAGGQNATIIYPAGTYLITTSITLQPQQHHVGYGAIFAVNNGVVAFARTTDGWPGRIKFSNIRFQGTATTGKAISITNNTPFVEIENCYFSGFSEAVLLDGSYCSSIKDSYFSYNLYGVTLLNATHSTSLSNCLFDGNTYTGLAIGGDPVAGNRNSSPTHNITTIGCAFQTGQYGVWAEECYELQMLNTYHEANTISDLKLGVADAGTYARACYNFTIDGWQSSSACASGVNIDAAHAVAGNFESLAFNVGTSTTATVLTIDGWCDRIYVDYHQVQTVTPTLTVPFNFVGASASKVTVSYNGATTYPRALEAIKFGTQAATPEKIYSGYNGGRPALRLESLGANQDMIVQVEDTEDHVDSAGTVGLRIDHLNNAVTFGYTARPVTDNTYYSGTPLLRWAQTYSAYYYMGAGSTFITSGTGSPEGVVTAPIGSIFTRTDAPSAITCLYVKTSGAGNTGWTAK